MSYPLLKQIHVWLAVISVAGFALRWYWHQSGSAMARGPWAKTWPHVVDTVFFVTGIALMLMTHQYPVIHTWLSAKLLALVAYIVLGAMSLRAPGRSLASILFFAAALVMLGYIFSVALSRSGWGFVGSLT